MTVCFRGTLWYWKGPAPHYFLWVPERESLEIKALERTVSYGWGCIPVEVKLGEHSFTTSLIPKEGRYLVPIRAAVRKPLGLEEGDEVSVEFRIA